MGSFIAITNQKGGVGKTTTAINLSATLAQIGIRTLLIDLDPQANATSGLGAEKHASSKNIYSILLEDLPPKEAIRQTALPALDLITSTPHLTGAEVELASEENRETILKRRLEGLREDYRLIFLDCPPSLGLLTLNALTCADYVLLPIQCEYYALEGLAQLMDTLQRVKESLNPRLRVIGAILTMHDSRISLARQVQTEIQRFFGPQLFRALIPRNVKLAEAPGFGKPIVLYDPFSRGAESYRALAQEFLGRYEAAEGEISAPEGARSETTRSYSKSEGTTDEESHFGG
ncbi:MAG: ParA family protein [Elusimicrobia bacterium]|nr:ParA family protein [Elusimicrobiota bacterium]